MVVQAGRNFEDLRGDRSALDLLPGGGGAGPGGPSDPVQGLAAPTLGLRGRAQAVWRLNTPEYAASPNPV